LISNILGMKLEQLADLWMLVVHGGDTAEQDDWAEAYREAYLATKNDQRLTH
jgi:hypothetical protein